MRIFPPLSTGCSSSVFSHRIRKVRLFSSEALNSSRFRRFSLQKEWLNQEFARRGFSRQRTREEQNSRVIRLWKERSRLIGTASKFSNSKSLAATIRSKPRIVIWLRPPGLGENQMCQYGRTLGTDAMRSNSKSLAATIRSKPRIVIWLRPPSTSWKRVAPSPLKSLCQRSNAGSVKIKCAQGKTENE